MTTASDQSESLGGIASQTKSSTMWKGIIAALLLGLAHQNSVVASFLPTGRRILSIVSSILGVLVFLIGFVNYYIGKDLRKCSPLNEHLAYVNEETQSSQCIKDLDKVASPQGLSKMWKVEIQSKNDPCKVLLTGVTGYVGRAFLFQILREIAEAERNGDSQSILQHKVYVMVRPKTRKHMTAAQRLGNMKKEPMFAAVQDQWERVVVPAESGDLQDDKCGMSSLTLRMLADAKLTHIVHCAADVNFNRPLADSAGINISPALQLQALAHTWPSCTRFVHCSTAFVNPGCGTPDAPMKEVLFPLGKYNAQELFDSMRGNQKLALEAKAELQFPNNYVFTKCVAEHLVAENNKQCDLRIIRPAIVGPAWVLPEPGWNGDKPSTITALLLLWGTRVIRFAPLNSEPTAMVPVDVVAVGILDAMISPFKKGDSPKEGDGEDETDYRPTLTIRNLTWSHRSPHQFVDGMRMAKYCLPVGVLKHHFTATEAAVSFALIDASSNFPFLYHILHRVFNLGPLKLLQFVCWVARISGIKSILDQLPVTKLLGFSDMLTLYRPYVARSYFFESSFNVPASLDMNQYCISLFTATHAFWTNLFPGTVEDLHELELMPEGRFDLWWALTLPCGTFTNRLIGYLACKIIRKTYGSAEVNFVTLFHAGRTLLKLEYIMALQKQCVVLVPTHRSLMDYILAKYIAFSMVGLGIDVPAVFANPEFEDPNIGAKIGKTKVRFDRHATLAAFLEGVPSPDGRLQKPRTKFLESLVHSPGSHNYTLIPLCIDYDRVDNDNQFLKAATQRSSDLGLLDMIKLYWQIRSCRDKQESFGDVRISFGVPTSLEKVSDLDSIANHIQNEHRRLTTVSDYQISAAEMHLKIPASTLKTAIGQLDACVWANKTQGKSFKGGESESVDISTTAVDVWRLHLQWLPRLAPYLADSHPKWARWILGGLPIPSQGEQKAKTTEMEAVLTAVCSRLDYADQLALQALGESKSSGVTVDALVTEMYALEKGSAAESLIYKTAASFVLEETVTNP